MEQEPLTPQNSPLNKNAIVAVVILAIGALIVYLFTASKPESISVTTTKNSLNTTLTKQNAGVATNTSQTSGAGTVPSKSSSTPASNSSSATETLARLYRDGIYRKIGNYRSPNGAETVAITLTIKDDIIVDAAGELQATNPRSINFQTLFVDNFKAQVVGKKLSEVSLTKVSGSSLAPKGFNDAVTQIQTDAKV